MQAALTCSKMGHKVILCEKMSGWAVYFAVKKTSPLRKTWITI